MKVQAYVTCYIILQKGTQVLAAQRANTGFMDGKYNFPSGHVEPEETLQQAAIREAYEEIGVRVDVNDLELKHVIYRASPNKPYIYFYRVTKKRAGEPRICEPDKCSDLKWIDRATIQDIDRTPGDRQAILHIQKELPVSTYISDF